MMKKYKNRTRLYLTQLKSVSGGSQGAKCDTPMNANTYNEMNCSGIVGASVNPKGNKGDGQVYGVSDWIYNVIYYFIH
jgi:hypothetical protein